jgi:hypothetical protein
LRTDVDDGASDTLGRSDDNVVVFGHLERIERFRLAGLDGGFVEYTLIDRLGDRVVDQFTQNQTV